MRRRPAVWRLPCACAICDPAERPPVPFTEQAPAGTQVGYPCQPRDGPEARSPRVREVAIPRFPRDL